MPLRLPSLRLSGFSRPKRYCQRRIEVEEIVGGSGWRREWVVARSLCVYRRIPLEGVPASRRDEAVKMALGQWSPFPDAGYCVIYRGAAAHAWAWDAARQRAAAAPFGAPGAAVLPECALRRPGLADGFVLLQSLDGVEAQWWREDDLFASRWWPQLPTLTEWNLFLRACGGAPAAAVPGAVTLPLAEKPWGRCRALTAGISVAGERRWVAAAVALLLIFWIWQGVGVWKWRQATAAIEAREEALKEAAAPIIAARGRALDDLLVTERLAGLDRYPSQLELMVRVAERFPRTHVRLVEWNYAAGTLNFVVEAPTLDPRFYVKTYQEAGLFEEVRAEKGSAANRLTISMRVRPKGVVGKAAG